MNFSTYIKEANDNNNKFYLISDILEKHRNIKDFIQEMENIFLGKIINIKVNNDDDWVDVGWEPFIVKKIEWFDIGISYLEVLWGIKYLFLNFNDNKLISRRDGIKIVEPIISEEDPYGEEEWDINEQLAEPTETMTINTLELRKELGETKFPDEDTDYEDFSFNRMHRISERFLQKMKDILIGNKVSYTGYQYHYHDEDKSYKCEDLIVHKINLNLNHVLVINSKEWPVGGKDVIGGAVDERYPITVKFKPRKFSPEDPYGEEEWD